MFRGPKIGHNRLLNFFYHTSFHRFHRHRWSWLFSQIKVLWSVLLLSFLVTFVTVVLNSHKDVKGGGNTMKLFNFPESGQWWLKWQFWLVCNLFHVDVKGVVTTAAQATRLTQVKVSKSPTLFLVPKRACWSFSHQWLCLLKSFWSCSGVPQSRGIHHGF